MIPKREILDIATSSNLSPQVIEKDYVLGWILAGINRHPSLRETWVFKGGTCLKKCYFETYRFSEDLDFTLTDAAHIDAAFLKKTFTEIGEWIYDSSGIEMPENRLIFDVYENPRGVMSCQGRIFYRGPVTPASKQAWPRIKLDLSVDEVLVEPPAINPVKHVYSDLAREDFRIRCYTYEEVFAEKIRALSERTRPRDLYDVINFYRRPESETRARKVREILQEKCDFKGIEMPTYAALEHHKDACAAGWDEQLCHQLQALPPFASFWDELPAFFDWLEHPETVPARARASIPVLAGTITGEVPSELAYTGAAAPRIGALDRIRFAAANHLCVELDYRRDDGVRKIYLIEPYSLRQSSEGHLLIYALKHDTSQIRAFRTDRIIGAAATDIPFTPKYRVEFLPEGPFSSNVTGARGGARRLGLPAASRRSSAMPGTRTTRRSGSAGSGSGIEYVYQCPQCGKKFTRSKMDNKLNPHKNKRGQPCPGRFATFVETKS